MFTFKKIALLGAVSLTAFAMSCSDDDKDDPVPDTTAIKKGTLALANNGDSYGDADNPAKGYSRSGGTLTETTAETIDVIAFAGSSITPSNSKIYVPSEAGEVALGDSDDIFWDLHEAGKTAPYDAQVYALPSEATTIIKGASTYGDLADYLDGLADFLDAQPETAGGSVDLAAGAGFLIITSKATIAAIPSAATTSSVALDLYYMDK